MKFNSFIGIDISKKTLDVTLLNIKEQKQSKHQQFTNDKKGFQKIEKWLEKLKVDFKTALFCMEHTGVYGYSIAAFLEEKEFKYSMVSGLELKRSMGIVRGKNDKIDAFKIAKYAYLYRDEIKIHKLSSVNIVKIKNLLKERERLVKMLTVEKQIQKEQEYLLSKATIKRSEKRLSDLKSDIKEIEKEIETIIEADESFKKNYDLCRSVTGIGLVNATLFIIFTDNFQKITNPRKYASYCGVAPFEHSSGTSIKGRTKVSSIANKQIKTQLSNAAQSAIVHDGELKKYYKRKMEEGKEFGVVLNAVKFKLITRVFAVVKRQTPYLKLRQAG